MPVAVAFGLEMKIVESSDASTRRFFERTQFRKSRFQSKMEQRIRQAEPSGPTLQN
jgi:hypothetical protein